MTFVRQVPTTVLNKLVQLQQTLRHDPTVTLHKLLFQAEPMVALHFQRSRDDSATFESPLRTFDLAVRGQYLYRCVILLLLFMACSFDIQRCKTISTSIALFDAAGRWH